MSQAPAERALDLAFELEPDIVILDLGLPDIDGSDVCRHLRRWYRGPIVVLSADGDEDRKIEALDEGADDYVTKPFSMRELLARLRVALRHGAAVAQAADPTVISVGDLQVDREAHVATLAGAPLPLARKEFALLAELARHRGRVLTHKALLAQVWGTADPAKTETLRVHVNQLRRKLGDGPRRPQLLTAAGVGYRLVEPGDP